MVINQEIILIIIFIVIVYFNYKINKLEQKSLEEFTITEETKTEIKTAVKQIYLADVEAIRILSNFAIQLSQGGFTVPGPITFNDRVYFKTKVFTENGLALNGQKLYIRGADGANKETGMDENHYIKSSENDKYLNTNVIDGVRICGNLGGVLSTNNGGLKDILSWNKDSINVRKINIVDANGTTVLTIDGGGAGSGMATIEGNICSSGKIQCNGLWPRSNDWAFKQENRFSPNNANIGWTNENGADNIVIQGYNGITFKNANSTLGTWNASIFDVRSRAKLNVVGLAGYIFVGGMPCCNDVTNAFPIVCSISKAFNSVQNKDATWLVNPGYKIIIYNNWGYINELITCDNTNESTPKLFKLDDTGKHNQADSWKVFFYNDEVKVGGAS